MEGSSHYLEQLEAAIETRRQWLEEVQIPRLKDALLSFQTLFEGAMGMLIRKGLLREDPYNYDQSFTDITIPKDDELPEFENSDEVSYRLASYRRQLKFVSAEYALTLKNLTLARIKKLSGLVSYINWLELGESSKSPTTKAFARAFMKVRMGGDTMASKILKDSEVQLIKQTHVVRSLLEDFTAYDRESWKAGVRRVVLPAFSLGTTEGIARRAELVRGVRREFPARMAGRPWYPSLVEDLADEELAEDAADRKAKVLGSLAVPVAEQPAAAVPKGRIILLDAVRILSRPGRELEAAMTVLEENETLVRDSSGSGGGWFNRFLGSDAAPRTDGRAYTVQYADPGVPTPKTESIDFLPFAAEVRKKASLLAALAAGTSPSYRRLASTSEEQLASFVDKQVSEVLLIHRRMTCLNTMMQARAMQEKKKAREIATELRVIKNAIVKATQRRHDYKGKPAG